MNISLKCPIWGKKSSIVLLGVGIVIGSLTGLSPLEGAENNLTPVSFEEPSEELDGRLIILQENSLLPISDSISSANQIKGQIRVIITAYSSTVDQTDSDPFITAAATRVRDGVVANNYLPMGTKIRIPELYGEKIFVVEDRMHSRKGNYHIDIWFSSYWEAKNFGVKRTYIEILEG